jgi:putative ABC transport system permease protein
MRWPSRLARRLRALFRRTHLEHELDDEMRFHLEMEVAANVKRGMSEGEARRVALAAFGGVERYKEECRDVRGVGVFEDLGRDIRFGVRMLRKHPGFAGVVVLTLGLGIGATTAVFGAVNGVLLAPLPFADSERLVTLWQQDRTQAGERDALSPANFLDLQDRVRSFAGVAVMEPFSLDRITPEGPEAIDTWLVSQGFFQVLGTPARLGRTFSVDDHAPGGERVVILGDGIWRESFGADPAVIGRTLTLDGAPHTVVGVMPPGFQELFGAEKIWAPKLFTEQDRKVRGATYLSAIGRLRPGVSPATARAELAAIAAQLSAEFPPTNASVDLTMVPFVEQLVGRARPALLVLLGAVGCLLLIACANVANLMLSRAVSREREFAVRTALGAGRWRVVRQLGVEAMLLALAGGVAGVLVARWGVEAIKALAPYDLPRREELAIDTRVLAFALVVSLGAALVSALVPALRAARLDVNEGLKTTGRWSSAGTSPRSARAALAGGQVALAVLLLVGAGLLARSLASLLDVERGFRADKVLTLTVQAWQYYPRPAERAEFVRQTLARLSSMPGVRAAGMTSSLPLHRPIGANDAAYAADGRPHEPGQEPRAHTAVVTSGYFDALGIARRRGRTFTAADDAKGVPVAIVNESMARRLWPGEDPVGKRLLVTFTGPPVAREVVGVVADVRHDGLDAEPQPGIFLPHAQLSTGAITFTLRTAGDPAAVLRAAKQEIWTVNPALPVSSEATMEQLLGDSLRERRFHLLLLGAFATVAVLLAAIGIYGVVSYTTSERTREIGVRMALGAQVGDVLGLVMRQGTLLAMGGVVAGLLAATLLTRVLRSMLFGVAPLDGATFLGGGAIVLVIAAAATLIPARRAAKVDPLAALRAE